MSERFARQPAFFDISPPLSAKTAVFPGDVPFSRRIALDFAKGDHLLLSSIATTLHIGAHADAPNHYHAPGAGIDARDPRFYFGPCQVIETRTPKGERVRPEHCRGNFPKAPRLLFKTRSFPDPERWNGDFCSLSPELIEGMAGQGVFLLGIDTPSIDPETSKDLESHQAVARHDLAVLEGLMLDHVPPGLYTLLALPLKITGADASPVRAILVNDQGRAFAPVSE